MKLRLILLRHAKSGWDDPGLSDHDRPLTDRGMRDAENVGAWLTKNGFVPGFVLSSTATRAAETCRIVADQLEPHPRIEFTPKLYHASPDTALDLLGSVDADTVMLVGHNPTMSILAELLSGENGAHSFGHYPTAAAVVFEFSASAWKDIQFGRGKPKAFVRPRDLR